MKHRGGFVLGMLVCWLAGLASCSKSVEGFCQSWVEDTCQAVTTCCSSGFKFDLEGCKEQLSKTCQGNGQVEQVHAGDLVFDHGAANECFGSISTCADIVTATQKTGTYAQNTACASVYTGFRPAGSSCTSANECQRGGDAPTCYQGICAKVVLSDDSTCSFSFDTLELRTCPDGTFCDTSALKPDPSAPPSAQQAVFSAKCKALPGVGQACSGNGGCATGAFCHFSGTGQVCAAQRTEGADCSNAECLPGLSCATTGGKQLCQKANGPGCYRPVVCGDGMCDASEIQTCPKDCGGGAICGDGLCEGNESVTCPKDCGGGMCQQTGDVCGSDTDCCSNFCDTTQHTCG